MTNRAQRIGIGLLLATFCVPWSVMAQAAAYKNWDVKNRLRIEHDDNVFTSSENELKSWKLIDQVDLGYNLSMENTLLSLHWRPALIMWENRPGDDQSFDSAFDASFNHVLSPRWSLSLKDTFRFSENPEQVDRGVTVRQKNEFLYNALLGAASHLFNPKTRLELAGRWVTLQYDEDDQIAQFNDYDLYVGGLTLQHSWKPETAFSADVRLESLEYATPERDSDTLSLGAGLEHTFNPGLLGSVRVGHQSRDFKSETVLQNDSTLPFFDLSLTYLPAPATRLTVGSSHSLFESDVYPYSSTDRSRSFVSLGHDFSASVSGYLTGSYTRNEYSANEAANSALIDPNTGQPAFIIRDGEEEWYQFSARLSYKISRRNSLEINWQYTDVESDVRENFKRNRGGVGWVLRI